MSSGIINEVVGGKYIIKSELGRGGSATVYLAKKISSNTNTNFYAIKTISTDDSNALKLLDRETQTLKRLNHPSIVKFIDGGYDTALNLVYLALEYLDGQKIKDYFNLGLDLKTKINLFLQIIDAVSHAHSKNIIHRDIKPDNIMVIDEDEQPIAKMLDFGISIITTTILTNTIKSYYTPLFAAPEQMQLKGVSRESDIFSLSMTFLYLLSTDEARDDFRNECNVDTLYNSALNSLIAIDNLGASLVDVLKKATSMIREERPKIDYIRKILSDIKDNLSEQICIIFSLTPTLKDKISSLNNFDKQALRIKRDVESKLKSNSGTVHILKIQGKQEHPNRLTVQIGIDTTSYTYRGFINLDNPKEIILYDEINFINPQEAERLFENGLAIKIDPVVEVAGNPRKGNELSNLVNQILQQEQQINNEIQNNKGIDATFSQWQSVIDIEKKIIEERKQSFPYTTAKYDNDKQLLIITLKNPISLEIYETITTPPLPVTISVKKQKPPYRESQWSVGRITDGKTSKNGVLVEQLYISIGDFYNPDIFESIVEPGKIETDLKVNESEIDRRRKALRTIRYGDSENTSLSKVIADPANIQPIEPLSINNSELFNKNLDNSQKDAVCKALATEDIFLIQGPPGTGKTSVITEIILQIIKRYPHDKILISSQSNIAVDNVLKKLSNLQVNQKNIKILRIGREEKIESYAKQFEIEKAIINWQESIRIKSSSYWENFEHQNNEVLLGVKKISEIESLKEMSQQLRHLVEQISQAANAFDSDLVISQANTSSQELADNVCEMIYDKLFLEEKILGFIKGYAEKFAIEYPYQKFLSRWVDEEYERLRTILGDSNQNYESFLKLKKLKEDWNDRLRRKQVDLVPIFMDGVNVIGATCLGVGNLKQDLKFDWVIVDEAGRSTGPETFVPMSKGKKIILVGDHKQLPPIIDKELQDRVLNEQEIQRKVLETSLFEYLYENLPKTNKLTLNYQYRMHPDIGNLVSKLFYEEMISSERVNLNSKQHKLTIFDKRVYWISTSDAPDKAQERENGRSYSNRYEAELIKAILSKIESDCESNNLIQEVGVIAGYSSQIDVIKAAIAPKDKNLWKNLNIEVHTVDAFQGGECDIIIYDLVRSNKQRKLGFTSDYRRLNVALSRAKQLLIIVGNDLMAYEGRTPLGIQNPFKPLIEYIDSQSNGCSRLVSKSFIP